MDAVLANLDDQVAAWCGALGAPEAHRPQGVTVLDVDDVPVLITTFHDGGVGWVRLVAVAATDVHPSVELLHELLIGDIDAVVGSWRLFDDGTLAFAATLPGSGLDLDGFSATLRRVARAATAPPLPGRCGGTRFTSPPVDPAT